MPVSLPVYTHDAEGHLPFPEQNVRIELICARVSDTVDTALHMQHPLAPQPDILVGPQTSLPTFRGIRRGERSRVLQLDVHHDEPLDRRESFNGDNIRCPYLLYPASSASHDHVVVLGVSGAEPLGEVSKTVRQFPVEQEDEEEENSVDPGWIMERTIMNYIIDTACRLGLLRKDLDYHFLRAAMVIIFVWFDYDKWHVEEIQQLAPLILHGPLIFWTIPMLGFRGTSILLGTSELVFGLLLFLGFWNKSLGILGALGSIATFIATLTIFPFAPGGWDEAAGGFPAMSNTGAFLLKDLVLLAVSFYLLKQDVSRSIVARQHGSTFRHDGATRDRTNPGSVPTGRSVQE